MKSAKSLHQLIEILLPAEINSSYGESKDYQQNFVDYWLDYQRRTKKQAKGAYRKTQKEAHQSGYDSNEFLQESPSLPLA